MYCSLGSIVAALLVAWKLLRANLGIATFLEDQEMQKHHEYIEHDLGKPTGVTSEKRVRQK